MNSFEEAAEEMRRQSEGPKRFTQGAINVAKTGLGLGAGVAGAATFAPLLKKVAPFLSDYIPENLAIKGLSKLSPKLGKFVNKAFNNGFDFKEVKDFLGEQVKESESAKDERNIIEQVSPELHQFILERIKKGHSPIQAGALATIKGSKFIPIIEKLKKDHKTGWGDIVEMIYGHGEKAPIQKKSMVEEETERFERGYRNPQQQQPSGDKWNQIASTLQNVLNS